MLIFYVKVWQNYKNNKCGKYNVAKFKFYLKMQVFSRRCWQLFEIAKQKSFLFLNLKVLLKRILITGSVHKKSLGLREQESGIKIFKLWYVGALIPFLKLDFYLILFGMFLFREIIILDGAWRDQLGNSPTIETRAPGWSLCSSPVGCFFDLKKDYFIGLFSVQTLCCYISDPGEKLHYLLLTYCLI